MTPESRRLAAYRAIPAAVVLLIGGAGYLGWRDAAERATETARAESMAAASDAAVAMLSYRAASVEQDLTSVRDRLTGPFADSYTKLLHDVVIPGAKEKKASASASVKAAASVSATPGHAVALLFVNNTVTIGTGKPATTMSGVRVTMDKVGDRWLVAGFDPV